MPTRPSSALHANTNTLPTPQLTPDPKQKRLLKILEMSKRFQHQVICMNRLHQNSTQSANQWTHTCASSRAIPQSKTTPLLRWHYDDTHWILAAPSQCTRHSYAILFAESVGREVFDCALLNCFAFCFLFRGYISPTRFDGR